MGKRKAGQSYSDRIEELSTAWLIANDAHGPGPWVVRHTITSEDYLPEYVVEMSEPHVTWFNGFVWQRGASAAQYHDADEALEQASRLAPEIRGTVEVVTWTPDVDEDGGIPVSPVNGSTVTAYLPDDVRDLLEDLGWRLEGAACATGTIATWREMLWRAMDARGIPPLDKTVQPTPSTTAKKKRRRRGTEDTGSVRREEPEAEEHLGELAEE